MLYASNSIGDFTSNELETADRRLLPARRSACAGISRRDLAARLSHRSGRDRHLHPGFGTDRGRGLERPRADRDVLRRDGRSVVHRRAICALATGGGP